MLLNFTVVLQAVLLVVGIIWCKEIFSRLRKDVAEFKASRDKTQRGVIIFLWLVTAGIIPAIVYFLWGLVSNILGAFR